MKNKVTTHQIKEEKLEILDGWKTLWKWFQSGGIEGKR